MSRTVELFARTCLLVLLASFAEGSRGKERVYYVAINEGSWDYAPSGKNLLNGKNIEDDEWVLIRWSCVEVLCARLGGQRQECSCHLLDHISKMYHISSDYRKYESVMKVLVELRSVSSCQGVTVTRVQRLKGLLCVYWSSGGGKWLTVNNCHLYR